MDKDWIIRQLVSTLKDIKATAESTESVEKRMRIVKAFSSNALYNIEQIYNPTTPKE